MLLIRIKKGIRKRVALYMAAYLYVS